MRRFARTAVLAAAAAFLFPASADAHAVLTRSDPADGSRVRSAPRQIRLWFSEDVSARFRSVRLVAPNGREVAGTRLRGVSRLPRALVLDVPPLRDGTYAVTWRVLAEADGHLTGGTTVFAVGEGAAPLRQAHDELRPSTADVAVRWLRFSLLALLVGGLAFVIAAGGRAPDRVLWVSAIAGVLAVPAGLAALVREVDLLAAALPGTSWVEVLASRWGRLWLAEEALLCGLVATALALRRHARRLPAACCAVALAAALAVVHALGSHAAALPGGRLPVAADAVHLLAAAVWAGGLAAFAVALGGRVMARRPFIMLIGGSAAALAVTGLYGAGRQVASVDALLTTFYGRTLLVKTGLVAGAGLLGVANVMLLGRGRGRAALVVEAGVAAAVLLAAGVLTASIPARGPEFAPPRPVRPATMTRQLGDLLVSLTVSPNRPGENVLNVLAASSRRPPPAPVTSIRVELPPSGHPVVLRPVERGRWFGVGLLPHPGASKLTVVVARDRKELEAPFRWAVERPDPARTVTVSSRRLSSLLDPLAALLLVGVLAGTATWLITRLRVPRGLLRPAGGSS